MSDKESKPLGRYLSFAYRSFFSLVDSRLEGYEIDSDELHLLLALYREDGRQQKELGEDFDLDKATMARKLEDIEAKDYIRREEDPEDRRRKVIYLTGKGRSREPEFRELLESVEKEIRQKLSSEEIESLVQNLESLCKAFDEVDRY